MSKPKHNFPTKKLEEVFDALYLHKCWLAAKSNGARLIMRFVTISQIDFSAHSIKNAYFFGCTFKRNIMSPKNMKEANFDHCRFKDTKILDPEPKLISSLLLDMR